MIKNGDIWINKKHGTRYRILEVARHTEDDYILVIYQSATYKTEIWARPYDLFFEKFTKKDD